MKSKSEIYGNEWYATVPRSIRKQAIFGVCLMVFAFGGFGVWAFRAPLAAAVVAQGGFVATGQNKVVQHLEGGIISDILVSEGDIIQAGDPILRLDETSATANERELALRKVRLEATEARLLAEFEGATRIEFPSTVLAAQGDSEFAAILDSQRLNFRSALSALNNDIAVLTGQIEAQAIRSTGYERLLESHHEQHAILEMEYETKEKLLEQGLIRQSELLAVKRALVQADGQVGRLEAEIGEIEKIKRRYETQIEQAREQQRETALEELQGVQAELDSIREQSRKARNVLERAVVTAPVAGTVVRMFYHTSGGVVEGGKPIAEIVPSNTPLIVEVTVPRTEIDSVTVGQEAFVRLTALNARTTPVLIGDVVYVSADAVSERAGGNNRDVYVARIGLSAEEIARVEGFRPTPGMPAEVMIQTASRTFAQYLAKPIKDSMSRAFLEE